LSWPRRNDRETQLKAARRLASSYAPAMDAALALHTEAVRRDLELLDYPRREWLTPRNTSKGEHIFDVVVVGAGQGGLATGFGLLRERVRNIVLLDENPLDRAGPWLNFARMPTLRTPKYLTGPDLGIANLTPRAWYEAQHGAGSFEQLGMIPRQTWAAYLAWYRQTLRIPVQAETRVGALRYDEQERAFAVPCEQHGVAQTLFARRVVLSTGIDGSGAWHIPVALQQRVPPELYAHTRSDIDFGALAGKHVVVLGAGASAFDNAATALDHGARKVDLIFRRKQLNNVNPYRWAEFTGFLKHHGDLPDPDKWRFVRQILRMGQLPPTDTLARAKQHPGFALHPGCGWTDFAVEDGRVRIETTGGRFDADFVIVGTGFVTDLRRRPELAVLESQICRWADRYSPPATDADEDLARHPYLGPSFEFTERNPGTAPYLQYLFNYTFGCLLSLGFGGASISGMKYSNARLVSGLTRSLFLEDRDIHFASLAGFDEKEF
jgi:cation diffusion facilitator CzcD-associated flavoprotein CzcO